MASDNEEHVWQSAVRTAGLHGQYWALVRVLINKGLITADELRVAMEQEAGRSLYTHMSCGFRTNAQTGHLEWFQE